MGSDEIHTTHQFAGAGYREQAKSAQSLHQLPELSGGNVRRQDPAYERNHLTMGEIL